MRQYLRKPFKDFMKLNSMKYSRVEYRVVSAYTWNIFGHMAICSPFTHTRWHVIGGYASVGPHVGRYRGTRGLPTQVHTPHWGNAERVCIFVVGWIPVLNNPENVPGGWGGTRVALNVCTSHVLRRIHTFRAIDNWRHIIWFSPYHESCDAFSLLIVEKLYMTVPFWAFF